jgi:hypothetical protein
MKLKICGREVEFYTLKELADLSGKSKQALFKLEARGVLPEPVYRTQYRFVSNPNLHSMGLYKQAKIVYDKYKEHGLSSLESDERRIFDIALEHKQILYGSRLYSEFIVHKLAKVISKFKQGKEISDKYKVELYNLIKEDEKLCQKLENQK